MAIELCCGVASASASASESESESESADVKGGLQDTSRGTAANRAYEKLKDDVP